jgi:hypothetical protein
MIPDSCPARATQGEKRLFRLFHRLLPHDFTVWYEPVIRGRYPDFTILAPNFGLLMLEVKGWYPKHIRRATNQEVELERSSQRGPYREKVANPICQVRDYTYTLLDLLKEEPLLRQPSGDHQGKLCFPYGFGVLFSNITRQALEDLELTGLFPCQRAICRDELQQLEAGEAASEIIGRLNQLLPVRFSFPSLTRDQINLIHGTVHREVVVRPVPATEQSVSPARPVPPEAKTFQVLDAHQEQIAKTVGGGHRIFFGVAGSGKTVLLLARARLIAQAERSVLFLCYNRSLAAFLRCCLQETGAHPRVRVRTFHGWASALSSLRKHAGETFEAFEQRLVSRANECLAAAQTHEKYDAVLVDEGHDFHPDWFRCCVAALRDPAASDLIIAVDGCQSLYRRPRSMTWKSVGVQAVGRSRRLATNYRNTREILSLAWDITQAPLVSDEQSETHVRVHPAKARRSGPPVAYRPCRGMGDEKDAIRRIVADFRRGGVPEEDIGVLYPRESGSRIADLYLTLQQSAKVCWITDPNDRAARDTFMARPGIRLSTIHSAKGLEFPVVILAALDQLPDQSQRDLERDSNLLYVGLTRAMNCLVVTWARKNFFGERIVKSDHAVPLNLQM